MLKKIKILAVIFFSIMICMLYIDNTRYYFGKGYGIVKEILPFNLRPAYWDWDLGNSGFRIEDESGLSVLAYKSVIESKNDSIEIKKIIEYGFNKNVLISIVKDINNQLVCVVLRPSDKNTNTFIKFEIHREDSFLKQIDKSDFKWINIEKNIENMHMYSIIFNYLIITIVIVIILILRRLIINLVSINKN